MRCHFGYLMGSVMLADDIRDNGSLKLGPYVIDEQSPLANPGRTH